MRCAGPSEIASSAIAGLAAGVWVATDLRRRDTALTNWLAATSVASAAAVLGCSALGVAVIAGALAGIVIGAGFAAVLHRPA